MKIAVINEISACAKNQDIMDALDGRKELEVYNVGMTGTQEHTQLTYIQTSIMSAVLLNTGICDMVIGGCGTGQGYLNAVLQFPNVVCGLIIDPLDAWLFSQINNGNCVSLALNKGYGWAADINLRYIFDRLFQDESGQGYPLIRAESQKNSREVLKDISSYTHVDFLESLKSMPTGYLRPIKKAEKFMLLLQEKVNDDEMIRAVLEVLYLA